MTINCCGESKFSHVTCLAVTIGAPLIAAAIASRVLKQDIYRCLKFGAGGSLALTTGYAAIRALGSKPKQAESDAIRQIAPVQSHSDGSLPASTQLQADSKPNEADEENGEYVSNTFVIHPCSTDVEDGEYVSGTTVLHPGSEDGNSDTMFVTDTMVVQPSSGASNDAEYREVSEYATGEIVANEGVQAAIVRNEARQTTGAQLQRDIKKVKTALERLKENGLHTMNRQGRAYHMAEDAPRQAVKSAIQRLLDEHTDVDERAVIAAELLQNPEISSFLNKKQARELFKAWNEQAPNELKRWIGNLSPSQLAKYGKLTSTFWHLHTETQLTTLSKVFEQVDTLKLLKPNHLHAIFTEWKRSDPIGVAGWLNALVKEHIATYGRLRWPFWRLTIGLEQPLTHFEATLKEGGNSKAAEWIEQYGADFVTVPISEATFKNGIIKPPELIQREELLGQSQWSSCLPEPPIPVVKIAVGSSGGETGVSNLDIYPINPVGQASGIRGKDSLTRIARDGQSGLAESKNHGSKRENRAKRTRKRAGSWSGSSSGRNGQRCGSSLPEVTVKDEDSRQPSFKVKGTVREHFIAAAANTRPSIPTTWKGDTSVPSRTATTKTVQYGATIQQDQYGDWQKKRSSGASQVSMREYTLLGDEMAGRWTDRALAAMYRFLVDECLVPQRKAYKCIANARRYQLDPSAVQSRLVPAQNKATLQLYRGDCGTPSSGKKPIMVLLGNAQGLIANERDKTRWGQLVDGLQPWQYENGDFFTVDLFQGQGLEDGLLVLGDEKYRDYADTKGLPFVAYQDLSPQQQAFFRVEVKPRT